MSDEVKALLGTLNRNCRFKGLKP
jgi:hypothetical protein